MVSSKFERRKVVVCGARSRSRSRWRVQGFWTSNALAMTLGIFRDSDTYQYWRFFHFTGSCKRPLASTSFERFSIDSYTGLRRFSEKREISRWEREISRLKGRISIDLESVVGLIALFFTDCPVDVTLYWILST